MEIWYYILSDVPTPHHSKTMTSVDAYFKHHNLSYEFLSVTPVSLANTIYTLKDRQQLVPWDERTEDKPYPLLLVVGDQTLWNNVINLVNDTRIPLGFIPKKIDFAPTIYEAKSIEQILDDIIQTTVPTYFHTIYYEEAVSGQSGHCLKNIDIGLLPTFCSYQSQATTTLQKWLAKCYFVGHDLLMNVGCPMTLEAKGIEQALYHIVLCHFHIDVLSGELHYDIAKRLSLRKFIRFMKKHVTKYKEIQSDNSQKIRLLTTEPQRIQYDGRVQDARPIDLTLTVNEQAIWSQFFCKEEE